VGHNFRRILAWLREFLCLFLVQLLRTSAYLTPLKSAS
jgi:transposase, IS5 family